MIDVELLTQFKIQDSIQSYVMLGLVIWDQLLVSYGISPMGLHENFAKVWSNEFYKKSEKGYNLYNL